MKKLLGFTLTILVLGSVAASADTMTLVSPPPGPSYGPYYISPYYLQLNGFTGPVLKVTCVDPNHDISKCETYAVIPENVTGQQEYQELAYLILMENGVLTNDATVSYAIWDIVDPSFAKASLGSGNSLL